MFDQCLYLRMLQPVQRYRGHVRAHRPWRHELRAISQHVHHRNGRRLLDEKRQELERGRVRPVQVLPDDEDGRSLGFLK